MSVGRCGCCAEEEAKGGDGEEGGESKVVEKPEVPPPRPKLANAALCLDTLGQNRDFTPSQIDVAILWADRLKEPMNRSEHALYVLKYKKHVQDLADAAAKAAADAAAAAGTRVLATRVCVAVLGT